MSIDSAAKRRSAASIKPILKTPLPTGTIGANGRAEAAWMYNGISFGVVVVRSHFRPELFVSLPPRDVYFTDVEEEIIFE